MIFVFSNDLGEDQYENNISDSSFTEAFELQYDIVSLRDISSISL